MTAPLYQNWLSQLVAPTWLQIPPANALVQSVALTAGDLIGNAANQAAAARMVEIAPVDSLAYGGQDRSLERYPSDTDATYRARLMEAWSLWPYAGSSSSIIAVCQALGFQHVSVWNNTNGIPNILPWPPDGETSNWSRFWVYLSPPFPPFVGSWVPRKWNDGGMWGQLGPDGTPYTWGSTATGGQISLLRQAIRKWSDANTICEGIWVAIPRPGQTGTAASITTGASAGNMRVTGLSGIVAGNVTDTLTISGAATGSNNSGALVGFPIVAVNSSTSVDVANPNAVIPDGNNGSIGWQQNKVLQWSGAVGA